MQKLPLRTQDPDLLSSSNLVIPLENPVSDPGGVQGFLQNAYLPWPYPPKTPWRHRQTWRQPSAWQGLLLSCYASRTERLSDCRLVQYSCRETDQNMPNVDKLRSLNLATLLLFICLTLPFPLCSTAFVRSFAFRCHGRVSNGLLKWMTATASGITFAPIAEQQNMPHVKNCLAAIRKPSEGQPRHAGATLDTENDLYNHNNNVRDC